MHAEVWEAPCKSLYPSWGDGWPHLPTAEAQGGAGEVLIWKKGALCHLVIGDLSTEAVAQCLRKEGGTWRHLAAALQAPQLEEGTQWLLLPPLTFLAPPAPVLTTGNLRKNQPFSQKVRNKPSYCSLLITLEVINYSHIQSFIQNHHTYWLVPTSSLWSWEQEAKNQEGGSSLRQKEAELRSVLGASWASLLIWSLRSHRTTSM